MIKNFSSKWACLFVLLAGLSTSFSAFSAPEVATYDELVTAIRQAQQASEQRIEAAVEQEKVREAWETGHLIQEHILLNQDRAKYGEKVLKRLAVDLEMSETELYYRVEFAKAYPIFPPAGKLTWSNYRDLLRINDPDERKAVAQEAEKESWTRKVLRKVIRERKVKTTESVEAPVQLPELTLGKTGQYQIVKINGELKVDLGFEVYHNIPEKFKGLKQNEVIAVNGVFFAENPHPNANDLFTYNAQVLDVVDGDTFHAVIDLGFETVITQRLRLRRIDAPELISADGKEAKKILEKILKRDKGHIVIKTAKSNDQDQYGRYLVDVWVEGEEIGQELVDSEVFTIHE